ncbi:MAG: carboxyltransferase domain-containing protein, partial [Bacteroidota bacterium]
KMSTLLRFDNLEVELKNFNNDFLILSSKEGKTLQKIGKAIYQKNFHFAEEVIVTESEVCVKLNKYFEPAHLALLQNLNTTNDFQQNTYKLPIHFNNHKDWVAVEKTTGLSRSTVIQKLVQTEWSVSMFGFLPGFVYLQEMPAELYVPRKKNPSKYISANSLAMGGKYLGIYSIDSPGGWHVIGQLPISVLNLTDLPPVAFNLEDKVILQPISAAAFEQLASQKISLKAYHA